MIPTVFRRFLSAVLKPLAGLALGVALSAAALAAAPVSTGWLSDVAVKGYDPVAYFEASEPVEGDSRHEYQWNGATWRFASEANRELFASDPQKYAPQYGGYCAWAVAQGKTAPIDPQAWRIVDGKLYLNYNQDIQKKWVQDIPGNIEKADANWPAVLEQD